MSELIRAFIAVKVPGNIADSLENFLTELRPLSRIKWVRRNQFHITLKFLGELEPSIIRLVQDLLMPLKKFKPFTIELNHIGGFPNLNAPRVLWLGGDKGSQELAKLSRKINDILYSEADLPLDDKKFRAHLTLARLKDSNLPEELVRKLGTVQNFSWLCDELFLMRSELTPGGPIYSQLL